MTFRLRLLGGVALEGPDGPLEGRIMQRRPLATLAVLALAPEQTVSREKIVGLLWTDEDGGHARRLLSLSLHAIRKGLGPESVLSLGDDLKLNSSLITTDVAQFLEACSAQDYERTRALYLGPLLDGFHLKDAAGFERWLDAEQTSLARRYGEALEGAIDQAEGDGDAREAIRLLRTWAAHDPYSSDIALRLITALDGAGDRPAAVQHIRIHTALLDNELGLEPDPRVRSYAAALERMTNTGERQVAPEAPDSSRAGSEPVEPERRRGPTVEPGSKPLRGFLRAIRTRAGLAVGAILLVTIGVSGWRLAARRGVAPPPSADQLIVRPFTVIGDEPFRYLEVGVADLLGTALDGAGPLQVFDTSRAAEAGSIVAGSVVAEGDSVRIRAELSGSRGASLEASASGRIGGIAALIDAIALDLLAGIYAGGAHRTTRLAARTAPSLAAFKAFLDGEDLLRTGGGAWETARAFETATEIDSTYALAQYRLAIASVFSWEPERAVAAAEHASRFSSGLSDRERQLIDGWRAFLRGDADRAEALLRGVAERDASDAEAWMLLGETLQRYNPARGRSTDEASEAFARARMMDPDHVRVLDVAIAQTADATEFDRAAEARLAPGRYASWRASPATRFTLGEDGAFEDLVASFAGPSVENPEAIRRSLNHLSNHVEDLRGALAAAEALANPRYSRSYRITGRLGAAEVYLMSGRRAESSVQTELAMSLDPALAAETEVFHQTLPFMAPDRARLGEALSVLERSMSDMPLSNGEGSSRAASALGSAIVRTYLTGLAHGRLGNADEALAAARRLESVVGPDLDRQLAADLARGVRAQILIEQGRANEALGLLEATNPLAPWYLTDETRYHGRVRERFLRGELLLGQGRDREALGWLEGVAGHYGGRPFWGVAHLHLAEAYGRLGELADAWENFEQVLLLFDEAEGEFSAYRAQAIAGLERLSRLPVGSR